jgi:hypothetical protein
VAIVASATTAGSPQRRIAPVDRAVGHRLTMSYPGWTPVGAYVSDRVYNLDLTLG